MQIKLTIVQGGMIEFDRTGVYPEYLIFYSQEFKRSWRVKLRNKKQTGKLKLNGKIMFEYQYSDMNCLIKKMDEDEFRPIDNVGFLMRD
jgi:hypothetical protein